MGGVWVLLAFLFQVSLCYADCSKDLMAVYRATELYRNHGDKNIGMAVAVVIIRDGKVLLNQRASGEWGFAGGKYEANDSSIEACAKREVIEEVGVSITNLRLKEIQREFVVEQGKIFITAIVTAQILEGEPSLKEPGKSKDWKWFSWDELPSPLFQPNHALIKSGFRPF